MDYNKQPYHPSGETFRSIPVFPFKSYPNVCCSYAGTNYNDEPEPPQEMKDRMRSENDYKINLKSEIEIRTLHEKVDHLLLDLWSKMIKIQQMQIEILEDIQAKADK